MGNHSASGQPSHAIPLRAQSRETLGPQSQGSSQAALIFSSLSSFQVWCQDWLIRSDCRNHCHLAPPRHRIPWIECPSWVSHLLLRPCRCLWRDASVNKHPWHFWRLLSSYSHDAGWKSQRSESAHYLHHCCSASRVSSGTRLWHEEYHAVKKAEWEDLSQNLGSNTL